MKFGLLVLAGLLLFSSLSIASALSFEAKDASGFDVLCAPAPAYLANISNLNAKFFNINASQAFRNPWDSVNYGYKESLTINLEGVYGLENVRYNPPWHTQSRFTNVFRVRNDHGRIFLDGTEMDSDAKYGDWENSASIPKADYTSFINSLYGSVLGTKKTVNFDFIVWDSRKLHDSWMEISLCAYSSCDADNDGLIAKACGGTDPNDLDSTPPAQVSNINNQTTNTTITLNWTNPTDTDFSHVILNLNGINIANTSTQQYTFTNLIPNTTYTITLTTADTSNNVNPSLKTLVITTKASAIIPPTPPTPGTNFQIDINSLNPPLSTYNGTQLQTNISFNSTLYPITIQFNLYNSTSPSPVNSPSLITINSSIQLPVAYIIPANLPDENYTLNATFTNSSGFQITKTLGQFQISLGVVPPTPTLFLTIHSPNQAKYTNSPVLLNISSNGFIQYSLNYGLTNHSYNVSKYLPPLSDGTHTIWAYATLGSNSTSKSVTFTVDTSSGGNGGGNGGSSSSNKNKVNLLNFASPFQEKTTPVQESNSTIKLNVDLTPNTTNYLWIIILAILCLLILIILFFLLIRKAL